MAPSTTGLWKMKPKPANMERNVAGSPFFVSGTWWIEFTQPIAATSTTRHSPYAHTGPTAWLPPLYPLLLAAIFSSDGATQGTLVQKRSTAGRSSAWYVTCAYAVPGEGMPIQREIKVPSTDAWKAALPKQAVTILYSPKNPNRFVVYELSGYTVRD